MPNLASATAAPAQNASGRALRADLLAGFLVFLIAMPLCLAIATASNFPPVCGIWTAVAGGLIATWISDSQLTIKGPAAGLIVIVAGSVTDLTAYHYSAAAFPDWSDAERLMAGYRMTLGIGVVAGVIQILFGLLRVGKLGDFFPLAAVHGLLASIGIIIISKSFPSVLGVDPALSKDLGPIAAILSFPKFAMNLSPQIALIGVSSLAILFAMPLIKNRFVRKIPSPLLVLMFAVPLGLWLGIDSSYRVAMPDVIAKPSEAFHFPEFGGVLSPVGLEYLVLFSLIGSLESLLSAKAVDLLDPLKRKSSMDRDLTAIGIANTAVAFIGGLPMISEIVRSSANINSGAQSRKANFFHGLFLLAAVLALPMAIRQIPLAALSAMLVFTGFRLAHPMEFLKTYKIGKEQLAIFLTTIVLTLLVDMLVGVLAGVFVKLILQMLHGVSFKSAWRPNIELVEQGESRGTIKIYDAAVFSNWLTLKSRIDRFGPKSDLTIDLSDVQLVDHSVMEKLHEMQEEFDRHGGHLHVIGLDEHRKLSNHPQAARKKTAPRSGSKATTVIS